jgi:hypothetical protein
MHGGLITQVRRSVSRQRDTARLVTRNSGPSSLFDRHDRYYSLVHCLRIFRTGERAIEDGIAMCRKRKLGRDEAAGWPRRDSSAAPPRWSALFEGNDGAAAVAVSHVLDAIDIDTMWCPGPGDGHGSRCPLVEEGHCELVEKADFVINDLGTTDPRCAAVAKAVDRTVHGDRPVAIVTGLQQAESVRTQLPTCIVVEGPLTRQIVEDIAQVK